MTGGEGWGVEGSGASGSGEAYVFTGEEVHAFGNLIGETEEILRIQRQVLLVSTAF